MNSTAEADNNKRLESASRYSFNNPRSRNINFFNNKSMRQTITELKSENNLKQEFLSRQYKTISKNLKTIDNDNRSNISINKTINATQTIYQQPLDDNKPDQLGQLNMEKIFNQTAKNFPKFNLSDNTGCYRNITVKNSYFRNLTKIDKNYNSKSRTVNTPKAMPNNVFLNTLKSFKLNKEDKEDKEDEKKRAEWEYKQIFNKNLEDKIIIVKPKDDTREKIRHDYAITEMKRKIYFMKSITDYALPKLVIDKAKIKRNMSRQELAEVLKLKVEAESKKQVITGKLYNTNKHILNSRVTI